MPGETDLRPATDAAPADAGSTPDPKLFVIAMRCGRLGNRLVLFANFIALAEEQGHRLVNFTFHSYANLFESTRRDIYCRYPIPKRRSWLDVLPGAAGAIRGTRIFYHAVRAASRLHDRIPVFDKSVVTLREIPDAAITVLDGPDVQARIDRARIVFVYGWRFRAPELVRRHAEKIRAYFQPTAALDQAGRQVVDRLRQNADVVVGVHIRLGDNWKWKGGQYFFPVSQYVTWMRELAEQFPGRRVSCFVCSDEPRNEREFPGLSVGLGPGSPVADLYALARCDYILGPLSTFSQWASFYGNKPLLHLHSLKDRIEREKFRVSFLEEIP